MGIKKQPSKAGLINLLARPIGIELEYSSVAAFKQAVNNTVEFAYWEHDGTLTLGGEELVFRPAGGDLLMKYISKIINLHENFPPEVDESCGFHVHVQAVDLTMHCLRRLIAMWCRVEMDIFGTLVAARRRYSRNDGHHYCRPMTVMDGQQETWQFTPIDVTRLMRKRLLETNKYSTTTPEERIRAVLLKKLYNIETDLKPIKEVPRPNEGEVGFAEKYSKWLDYNHHCKQIHNNQVTFDRIKAYKRTNNGAGGCRYASMNVHSYFYRGTIEFRLKEGTLDPEEIIFWPLFCGWFVEAATQLRDDEVMAINSLGDWISIMKTRCIMQPSVLEWVEGKMKNEKSNVKDNK